MAKGKAQGKTKHMKMVPKSLSAAKVGNRWGIVDQCWGLQGAAMEGMVDPDYESEDNF